jgi:hypothetical protein
MEVIAVRMAAVLRIGRTLRILHDKMKGYRLSRWKNRDIYNDLHIAVAKYRPAYRGKPDNLRKTIKCI